MILHVSTPTLYSRPQIAIGIFCMYGIASAYLTFRPCAGPQRKPTINRNAGAGGIEIRGEGPKKGLVGSDSASVSQI